MQLASQFTLILLLICELAVAAPPIAKPGCPESCGNISIPFPFGIGADCYLNEWYEITCDNKNVTHLTSIKMEVLKISLYDDYDKENVVLVRSPIIFSNCSGGKTGVGVNLTGTPFFFSPGNSFTAVGCNNHALLTQIEPEVVGCESSCDDTKVYHGEKIKCNGTKCCQATIPLYLQMLNVSIKSMNESQSESGDGCKLAFIADDDWIQANIGTDPLDVQYMEYVPAVLGFMIWVLDGTLISSGEEFDLRSCSNEARISNYPNATRCKCSHISTGGNPYLDGGCLDDNECKDPERYGCPGITTLILAIGLPFGLLLLVIGASWLHKLIKKRKKIELKKQFFKRNGGLLLQQQLSSSEGNVEKTKVFSSKELDKATNHFNVNRILGQGGQGTVYKGMLDDGRIVAVKKSIIIDEGNLEEFINEVVVLSHINHRNVVTLLGCWLETEVPLLVYEFIPNGNLYQYLHDQNEEFPISWEMRIRIATEVAGALSYLHSAASIPIYHRDIKSTNILLDEKYRAKVSDFGTSRSIAIDQTHLTTHVKGTFGYLDPEYFRSSQFTDKSDVYSFGVVLVELLTGQKPIFLATSQDPKSLATHFIISMKENRIFDILDAQVRKHCDYDEIMAVANLAKRCLSLNGKKRPTMKEVTMELERIRLLQKPLNVQNNHKEVEYMEAEISNPWEVASTSRGSGFDGDLALSLDIEPLMSRKSW